MVEWYRKRRVGDLPADQAARNGDREGLVFGDSRYTFSQISEQVDRVARGLMAQGVGRGDHVALWLNNSDNWMFLQYAIAKVGAVLVPINTRFRTSDLEYILRQSDSAFLITQDVAGPIDFLGMVREIVELPENGDEVADPEFPELRKVIVLGENDHRGVVSWPSLLNSAETVDPADLAERAAAVDPDDTMLILYTSGTTGFPKGAMHSHIMIRNMEERGFRLSFSPNDTILNFLPLYHAFGISEGSFASMINGSCQVLTELFDAGEVLDLIEREKATVINGFDTHFNMLMDEQKARPRDISSLRCGFLPAGPSNVVPVARRVAQEMAPYKSYSAFGMTEVWVGACVGSLGDTQEQACETSGVPALGMEVRVVNPETGAEDETGEHGEIQLRGYMVMKGYYKKPDETRATFTEDGWLKSGDTGCWRPDGYLRFFGRYKDMLKVGGENVDPLEVEGFLLAHPDIVQVSVVDIPDRKLGMVPVAFIQKAPRSGLSEGQAIAFCKGKLASYKIPRHAAFVDEFPMTGSGKIKKIDLRAQAKQLFSSEG